MFLEGLKMGVSRVFRKECFVFFCDDLGGMSRSVVFWERCSWCLGKGFSVEVKK